MKKDCTMYSPTMLEEELKKRVGEDFFQKFDCANILGRVDFSVCVKDSTPTLFDNDFMVWGEAKRGYISDFKTSFVQLILTIGKERTFDKYLPPRFLCEFDCRQIAFLPYDKILEIFYISDFNWNVAPSDHRTSEFSKLYTLVNDTLESQSYIFKYVEDEKQIHSFIKNNFKVGLTGVSCAKITKNNFISIYNRWLTEVKPTIAVNWEILKRSGVIDADFYLADIMSKDNMPIMDKLQVLLMSNHYMLARHIDESGLFASKEARFSDNGVGHSRFWLKYVRPPKKEYQEYILGRRDLLVPQDIRERKGSYFTPQCWVEKAYNYLEDYLGEDWQDKYYIWDCCAGTGNLLAGLSNKYNVYASTLDKSDVDVMQERIRNGANLLPDHVFQFDFLNDGLKKTRNGIEDCLRESEKLPQSLRMILADEEKRKKLVIFINSPYSEIAGKKKEVNLNMVHDLYARYLSLANRELFAQFLIRIYKMLPGCVIGEFSKQKALSGSNFQVFRQHFTPKIISCFVVPSYTFDNVDGDFPIGFKIWDTKISETFSSVESHVYDKDGNRLQNKGFYSNSGDNYISSFVVAHKDHEGEHYGWLDGATYNDFQKQTYLFIANDKSPKNTQPRGAYITRQNFLPYMVFFAVRWAIAATWLNDRDQFLVPEDSWQSDHVFINDCIAFSLFHGQNRISRMRGRNHWIPFSETEVGARDLFSSHFVYDYIHGNLPEEESGFFNASAPGTTPLQFSPEATAVFDAGRELWRYYHSQENCNADASYYDIRGHFQGMKANGKMNARSTDAEYTRLVGDLRNAIRVLAQKIEPKIYEYGFLKR